MYGTETWLRERNLWLLLLLLVRVLGQDSVEVCHIPRIVHSRIGVVCGGEKEKMSTQRITQTTSPDPTPPRPNLHRYCSPWS